MDIGKTIKKLRTEKGWTQKLFAEKCGVTDIMVVYWEGGRSAPTPRRLAAVAKAFGMSVTAFMLQAVTDEDVPEGKRELYKALVAPLQKMLREEETE